LRIQTHEASEGLQVFKHALVGLESTLRIAEAAGAIPLHINQLLFEQLLGVQRYVSNHYIKDEGFDISEIPQLSDAKPVPRRLTPQVRLESASRRKSVRIPAGDISSDAYFVYSKLTDRAERIKTVLEAKPQATIRDIAEIITDVSEKTIQRELNSLIEKGQVQREGERRWSRYSVKK
jgi:DNA-binding transcriptional ArsR family regulator